MRWHTQLLSTVTTWKESSMIWDWAFRQPSLPLKGLNFCIWVYLCIICVVIINLYTRYGIQRNTTKKGTEDPARCWTQWGGSEIELTELTGLVQAVTAATSERPWSTCPEGSSAWPACKPSNPGLSPGLSHLLISKTEWLMFMYWVTRWSTRYSHPDLNLPIHGKQ